MIFDQILFHNVEELEETEKGYLLRRVCKKVRDGISDGVQNNRFATGVELRFRMTDGAVDLTLSSELVAESATVHIFFGSFQGGGEYSSKNVGPGNTTIHIEYPTGMEKLRQLCGGKTKRGGRAFGRELRYMISPVKMAEDSRSQRISTIFIILWRSHPEAVICRGTEDCCSAPAETSKCGVHSTGGTIHPVIMPH